MTILRSCYGCAREGQACETRDTFKAALRGLHVTSVKWKCKDRKPRFEIGDPVWALTVDSYSSDSYDGPCRDEFPGTVIRISGSRALVYIAPGSLGKSECLEFEAFRNGFCMLPMSRLSPRDGQREVVCRACELPASFGHQDGYSCAYALEIGGRSNG